jgi:hypothetical protein
MAKKQPRSGFVWFVLGFGLAGIFHRRLPAELWPEEDWLGLVLVNSLLILLTFFPSMISSRPARPFLRWGEAGMWLGRAGLAAGILQLLFVRKNLASAFLVSVSSYLVAWALFGADKLISGSWRVLGARTGVPRTGVQGALAKLSSEPMPLRQPSISMEDWLAAIYKICKRIDYWDDAEALRGEVYAKLESQECLHHYRRSMDESLWQAAMHFVRSVGSRNVKVAAKEMASAYRRSQGRPVIKREGQN